MDDPAVARFTLSVARTPSGLWIIDSPDLKGLMVTGRTFTQAMEAVPGVVEEIRKALADTSGTDQARTYERIFS